MHRAALFPDLIVCPSPNEKSADPIPSNFEVTMQATKPRTLVYGKEFFYETDHYYHREHLF